MHSYIITGIRMGPFMRLLRKHGFSLSPRKLARVLYILQNSVWASFFTWLEKKRYRQILETYPVPDDPVIIIGHWRTGSTFLHDLLACDPKLAAPSLFQVTFPESFMISERYFRPVMSIMLKRRPMDNMELGFDSPQEDEFALLKLTFESPYIKFLFPDKPGYFFNHPRDFYPPATQQENWKRQFRDYCRKISRDSGRKVLLKNPMHSMRIPLLLETFSHARFIHIHRHPYRVVPSTMHLWKVMADDNQLRGESYHPSLEEVTQGLNMFYEVINKHAEKVPEGQYYELKYEDLERDPAGEIRKIYGVFGLDFTGEFEKGINGYLERTRRFKKNSYTFGDDEKRYVRQELAVPFERYHYED